MRELLSLCLKGPLIISTITFPCQQPKDHFNKGETYSTEDVEVPCPNVFLLCVEEHTEPSLA